MSKAHVSEATHQAGSLRPGAAGSLPSASGRKPFGSRTATSASSVSIASEKAPSHCETASMMRATGLRSSL